MHYRAVLFLSIGSFSGGMACQQQTHTLSEYESKALAAQARVIIAPQEMLRFHSSLFTILEILQAGMSQEAYNSIVIMSNQRFLAEAVKKADYNQFKQLYKQCTNFNFCADNVNLEGLLNSSEKQLLHIAAAQGCKRITGKLLQADGIDRNAIGYFTFEGKHYTPMTPLLLALACGRVSLGRVCKNEQYEVVVELLVGHNAQVNKVGNSEDPFLFALKYGTPNMVKILENAKRKKEEAAENAFFAEQAASEEALS
jgi:hypothetical protein